MPSGSDPCIVPVNMLTDVIRGEEEGMCVHLRIGGCLSVYIATCAYVYILSVYERRGYQRSAESVGSASAPSRAPKTPGIRVSTREYIDMHASIFCGSR